MNDQQLEKQITGKDKNDINLSNQKDSESPSKNNESED